MYKYTIKAFDQDATIGAVNIIEVIVKATNVEAAVKRAAEMAPRQQYNVISVEDLTDTIIGSEIKKG